MFAGAVALNASLFDREHLLSLVGSTAVTVGTLSDLSRNGWAKNGQQHKLADFIKAMRSTSRLASKRTRTVSGLSNLKLGGPSAEYVFDTAVLQKHHAKLLDQALELPLRQLKGQFMVEESPMLAIAALGAAGSGVYFHRHDAALNFLLHGQKRWLLYPPLPAEPAGAAHQGTRFTAAAVQAAQPYLSSAYGTTAKLLAQIPDDSGISKRLLDGLTSVEGESDRGGLFEPHSCVQQAGDLVYVPGESCLSCTLPQ